MSRTSRTPGRSITARPSQEEKARFCTLAHAAGISESRLALMAIRAFVDAEGGTHGEAECDPAAERVRATDRITIRLRPGDGAVIARRARERGVKTATYLAAMARAHIAADPPLFTPELAALKQSIAILSGLGLLLGQGVRSSALSAPELEEVRQTLSRTRAAVAALEQRTHDFAKAALMAWESRFDE
ncbi:MAG: hypothetical protein C5B58_02305 [Acidobacteria bacterium]|nr:MAG: hypothetical protein C5B58_02305 [Acidobacteriota bacterium]